MGTDYQSKEIAEKYSEYVVAEESSLKPVILRLIKDVQDKKVLDLGCGDGRYSYIMAQDGAMVTAIDASNFQLDIAKKIHNHPNIKYILEDVSKIKTLEVESFDIILANLLLPDLDDIKKMGLIFKTANSLMKKGSIFIVSGLHPLYLSPEQDNLDKPLDFRKENYYKEGSNYKAKAVTKKGSAVTFDETHYSLTYLSEQLEQSGLYIKRIIESKQVAEKRMFLPKYIVLVCQKFSSLNG